MWRYSQNPKCPTPFLQGLDPPAERISLCFQALLFGDETTHQAIMQTADPRKVKALGRQVWRCTSLLKRQNSPSQQVIHCEAFHFLFLSVFLPDPGFLEFFLNSVPVQGRRMAGKNSGKIYYGKKDFGEILRKLDKSRLLCLKNDIKVNNCQQLFIFLSYSGHSRPFSNHVWSFSAERLHGRVAGNRHRSS